MISDDQGDSGFKNSLARVGEGAGIVQGFLQQVHNVPERQNAKRKSAAKRLQSSWSRFGSVQWKQRQQSPTG